MSFSRRKGILLPRKTLAASKSDKSGKIRYSYNIQWIYPMLFAVCVVAFTVVYLCQYARIIRVRYNISRLKQQKANLIEKKRLVKLNIEKMAAPERVEKIARTRLKMIHPQKRVVLTMKQPASVAEDSTATVITR